MRISAVVALTLAILGAGCGGYGDGQLDDVSSTAGSLTLMPGPPHIELCGDGTCQAWPGETCSSCPQDRGEKHGEQKMTRRTNVRAGYRDGYGPVGAWFLTE